jgi:hypothetical protein
LGRSVGVVCPAGGVEDGPGEQVEALAVDSEHWGPVVGVGAFVVGVDGFAVVS